jgi:hypothetical protein
MPLRELSTSLRFFGRLRIVLALIVCWFSVAMSSHAAGPRWVTGPPFFTTSGVPVVWYTNQPLYFTDPGNLSSSVNHAAAEALVAAAANVWNVPTASLVLSRGGSLDEHVSGANTFLGPAGLIFPADVQSSNFASKQIAVIYDSDGSVTDLLLGNGASDASNCLQNGVTESVDSIVPAGYIQHALLVLNGRCTGSDPQKQMQLQYQLMRAFGRVLGLGWSQTNDNVFTGSPRATFNQAMHWPVMHPIDIICGTYTYQCMPQPFTLRPDDLSSLAQLYFIGQGQAGPGKTDTLFNANQFSGSVTFPTGQGMQGVNVVVRRWAQYTDPSQIEDWYTTSSVSGYVFRQSNGNPVTGPDTSFNGSEGTVGLNREGFYDLERIPMLPGDWQQLVVETEPMNSLYTGPYAVGPYTTNAVEPSGANSSQTYGIFGSYQSAANVIFSTVDAASACDPSLYGTETAPVEAAATGWWPGLLCWYGHTAWSSLNVKGNRSLTLEVTAVDEQGFATTAKAMPVIGVWSATDPVGSLPGVAAAGEPFNGEATGMTTVTTSFTQPDQLRIVVADQRGDGRSDFNFQARALYADSLMPAAVSAAGGTVTITGMGFRTGNAVFVNGVAATVSSWNANTIVARVPSLRSLGSSTALVADVKVEDLSTGGTTVMTHALSYSAPVTTLSLLAAPSGTVVLAQQAATPFAVQVLEGDGVTPVVGEAITFTATSGAVQFAACGAATCTLHTDVHGIASTFVTPETSGVITLQATGVDGTATVSFTALAQVRTATAVQPVEYIVAGAIVTWTPQLRVADNIASTNGTPVDWQTVTGSIVVSPGQSQVNATGTAQTLATAGSLAPGAQAVLSGCAWTTVCATFTTQGVDPADLRVIAVSGGGQIVSAGSTFTPVVLRVTDGASNPVAGAVVEIYQTVDAWQPACPDRGRCPIPPILASSQYSVVSDANGLLTITPQQLSGLAETSNLAAATGSQGFVSLMLEKQPKRSLNEAITMEPD